MGQNRKVFEKDHDVILELKIKEDYKGFKMVENWRDLNVITNQETDKNLLLSSILVKIDSVPISELPPKEYVFVVDCSGSMHGQRIKDARSTLQQLVNSRVTCGTAELQLQLVQLQLKFSYILKILLQLVTASCVAIYS